MRKQSLQIVPTVSDVSHGRMGVLQPLASLHSVGMVEEGTLAVAVQVRVNMPGQGQGADAPDIRASCRLPVVIHIVANQIGNIIGQPETGTRRTVSQFFVIDMVGSQCAQPDRHVWLIALFEAVQNSQVFGVVELNPCRFNDFWCFGASGFRVKEQHNDIRVRKQGFRHQPQPALVMTSCSSTRRLMRWGLYSMVITLLGRRVLTVLEPLSSLARASTSLLMVSPSSAWAGSASQRYSGSPVLLIPDRVSSDAWLVDGCVTALGVSSDSREGVSDRSTGVEHPTSTAANSVNGIDSRVLFMA